jgi:hypothetical protein
VAKKGQSEAWAQRGLLALGGATAIFLSQFYPLMTPSGKIYYHSTQPLTTIALAYLVDVGALCALLLTVIEILRRTRQWIWWRLVLAVLLPWLCVVVYPELVVAVLFAIFSKTPAFMGVLVEMRYWIIFLLLVLWAGTLLGLRKFAPRAYGRVITAGKVFAMGMGIFGLIAVYQLARAAAWKPAASGTASWHERTADATAKHPRVVWIVFDELSYAAVYESQWPGKALPEFERFGAESYVYTNARPMSYWTENALPSLIEGKQVQKLKYRVDGRLRVYNHGEGWSDFNPAETVFGKAEEHGWNSGIVGWYNPYCSLLRDEVQGCYWAFRQDACGPALGANTVWHNVKETWRFSDERLNQRLREEHVEDRRDLVERAAAMMADERYDFIFVHVPIPHPPNVYDGRTGRWTTGIGRSYADSLALADRVLGRFVTVLGQSPRWGKTTVVVQGDHSWRVPEWKGHPEWTVEDEKLSNSGKFDDRPFLLVHLAGQADGVKVTAPVPLLRAHDIVVSAIENGGVAVAP